MKVGDYVRTYDGVIGKIIDDNLAQEETRYELDYNNKIYYFNQIIKSSPKIINLIEVGDLVNNHIVGQILYENQTIDNIKYLDLEGVNILVCNDDIKSILTKECFESMEYKVGELDER